MNIETKQPKSDRETNYLTLHKKWSFPLSLAQMKDKMVLSYLKLKKIVLSPWNKVCSHSQQKRFKCLRQF